jgi:hypothetical protein
MGIAPRALNPRRGGLEPNDVSSPGLRPTHAPLSQHFPQLPKPFWRRVESMVLLVTLVGSTEEPVLEWKIQPQPAGPPLFPLLPISESGFLEFRSELGARTFSG